MVFATKAKENESEWPLLPLDPHVPQLFLQTPVDRSNIMGGFSSLRAVRSFPFLVIFEGEMSYVFRSLFGRKCTKYLLSTFVFMQNAIRAPREKYQVIPRKDN